MTSNREGVMKNPKSDGLSQEVYTMDAHCQNCGMNSVVEIPKGKTAREFQKDYLCRDCNCGCVEIRPMMRFR